MSNSFLLFIVEGVTPEDERTRPANSVGIERVRNQTVGELVTEMGRETSELGW